MGRLHSEIAKGRKGELWSHLNMSYRSVLMHRSVIIYSYDQYIKKWAQSDAWEAQKCRGVGAIFGKCLMSSDVRSVAST